MTQAFEANFDGLVGPTHNYAGLSVGNVASLSNAKAISNPKEAALQGLRKMKALHDLGLKQGVIAPNARPDLQTLRRLGFRGNDSQVVSSAMKRAPEIVAACFSASNMWTANAATVSPSPDSADGRVHFTAANLASKFHRSIEAQATRRILQAMFANEKYFAHHEPLPSTEHLGDEGAANHTRLSASHGAPGVEFFVYGKHAFDDSRPRPKRYPARQTFEASDAIARLHGLSEERTVIAQQNPEVIDEGVFHNDVIAVGNENVLFHHERAFLDSSRTLGELRHKFGSRGPLHFIEVKESQVSVQDAVATYLFNSQLVTLPSGPMAIIAPEECRSNPAVWNYLQELITLGTPVREVKIYDVKQSMRNGGGPACLRLRVVLTPAELGAVNPSCLMSEELYARLVVWVEKNYRDRLSQADFADPKFLTDTQGALDELTGILGLGSVYPFQQA